MRVSGKTIVKATKWSVFAEMVAKLITPISSMILARLLAPSVYGIVASVSMVLAFCELFADAGFNKYIIRYETNDEQEVDRIVTIAFWTNLVLTLAIWAFVSFFSVQIANIVGCAGYHFAITVSCSNLPLHGFISIQSAKLKRDMDFKTIFKLRMLTLVTPFAVTIPIAFFTGSYWAIIIGNISSNILYIIAMTIKTKWLPGRYFSFTKLKEMFSFSMWSMLEAFFVWMINWGDVFIVSHFLNSKYLGIYKTSMNMVGQITGVISASIVPVHLSSLSKAQDNDEEFKKIFYRFSEISGILLIPMGVGMFIYRDLMCNIALGDAWIEGAEMMGIWGFVNSIAILFNSFNGNILIAKGRPKVSVIIQILQILVIIPIVYITAQMDFTTLSYARALIRVFGMVIYSIVIWKMYKISAIVTIKKLMPVVVSVIVMSILGILFTYSIHNQLLELCSVMGCVLVYFIMIFLFPNFRRIIINATSTLLNK